MLLRGSKSRTPYEALKGLGTKLAGQCADRLADGANTSSWLFFFFDLGCFGVSCSSLVTPLSCISPNTLSLPTPSKKHLLEGLGINGGVSLFARSVGPQGVRTRAFAAGLKQLFIMSFNDIQCIQLANHEASGVNMALRLRWNDSKKWPCKGGCPFHTVKYLCWLWFKLHFSSCTMEHGFLSSFYQTWVRGRVTLNPMGKHLSKHNPFHKHVTSLPAAYQQS